MRHNLIAVLVGFIPFVVGGLGLRVGVHLRVFKGERDGVGHNHRGRAHRHRISSAPVSVLRGHGVSHRSVRKVLHRTVGGRYFCPWGYFKPRSETGYVSLSPHSEQYLVHVVTHVDGSIGSLEKHILRVIHMNPCFCYVAFRIRRLVLEARRERH